MARIVFKVEFWFGQLMPGHDDGMVMFPWQCWWGILLGGPVSVDKLGICEGTPEKVRFQKKQFLLTFKSVMIIRICESVDSIAS